MTQTNEPISSGPQQQNKVQLDLKDNRNVLQDGLRELNNLVSDGASLFVLAAQEGRKLCEKVYTNLIKPYAPAVGAVAVVGAAGAAGVSTLGVGGTAIAVGYTLWSAATAAAGVAGVGALARVCQWIHAGSKAVFGAVADRIDDAKAGLMAIKHGVQVAASENRNHRLVKSTGKLETKEGQVVKEVVQHLTKLEEKHKENQEAAKVIAEVKTAAEIILKNLKGRIVEITYKSENANVSVNETQRQVNSFMSYLKDELKQNILAKYANLSDDLDPAKFLSGSLDALKKEAADFKVQAKGKKATLILEDEAGSEEVSPSGVVAQKAETAVVHNSTGANPESTLESGVASDAHCEPEPNSALSKYSSFFGNQEVSKAVEKALDELPMEPSESQKNKAVKVIQAELLGFRVTLNPGVISPIAEVIKRASIPQNREIPHFKDLYLQLKNSFPNECSLSDGKIFITGKRRSLITLENRHGQHGGKVTVFFGKNQQGGMWNDKVEEVVRAFINNNSYPQLEPARVETQRVVATTKSSRQEARELYQELKKELGEAEFGHCGAKWKIKVGDSVIYAKRQGKADSRKWEILNERNEKIAEEVAIKDLKAAVKKAREEGQRRG